MSEVTKDHLDKQFEKMATMIAKGFDETASKVELTGVENRLSGKVDSVESRLGKMESKFDIIQGKLDNILYKEIVGIETRVSKIEKHLGLKPA